MVLGNSDSSIQEQMGIMPATYFQIAQKKNTMGKNIFASGVLRIITKVKQKWGKKIFISTLSPLDM